MIDVENLFYFCSINLKIQITMGNSINNLFIGVRKIAALSVVCMLFFAVISCDASKEVVEEVESCDKTEQFADLKGTSWKLVGIVDIETGILQELDPKHCIECYTLTFETDRVLLVRGITFTFKIDLDNLSPWVFDDLILEKYDGNYYLDSDKFRRTVSGAVSYSVTDNELRLYVYHNGNPVEGIGGYSLFKRIEL